MGNLQQPYLAMEELIIITTLDVMAYHALIGPNVLIFFFVIVNSSTKYSLGDVLVFDAFTLGAFPWMADAIRIVVFAWGFGLR